MHQRINLFPDLLRYFVVAQLDIPIRQLVGNTDLALQQILWAKGKDLDISNMWMEVEIMDINRVTQRKAGCEKRDGWGPHLWSYICLKHWEELGELMKAEGWLKGWRVSRSLWGRWAGGGTQVMSCLGPFAFVFLLIISGPEIWLTREKRTKGQGRVEEGGRTEQWLRHCSHDPFLPHTPHP